MSQSSHSGRQDHDDGLKNRNESSLRQVKPVNMGGIKVHYGNILDVPAAAIVNAANSSLMGGGGIDGMIHRAAGPELQDACRQFPVTGGVRCVTGDAVITRGFRLPFKHVIHTVGPVYDYEDDPGTLLKNCYRNCIARAQAAGIQSVVFPCISTGIYGYPMYEAALVAIEELSAVQGIEVTVAVFNDLEQAIWRRLSAS